jgi:hypothetical protein
MGAAVVKAPEFALTEEESKQLAAAITRVTDLYDVPLLDEKSRAWLNLGIVGVQIYGTRGAAVILESKRKRAAKPSVVQMPQQQQTGGIYGA